jgi:hypothetical protein
MPMFLHEQQGGNIMRRVLHWIFLALAAKGLMSCKTTGGQPGYRGGESSVVDGVPYRDPGPVEKTRNAFNGFRM